MIPSAKHTALAAALALAIFGNSTRGEEGTDRVLFKSGMELVGTIVHVDEYVVVLERGKLRQTFAKPLIRRIDDTATTGAYFAGSQQLLPPWRALANDLRHYEEFGRITRVGETAAEIGPLAQMPGVQWLLGDGTRLFVYGDPGNPTALRFELEGFAAGDKVRRAHLRSLLAGFLTRRSQVSTLYDLNMNRDRGEADGLAFEFETRRTFLRQPTAWSLMVYRTKPVEALPIDAD